MGSTGQRHELRAAGQSLAVDEIKGEDGRAQHFGVQRTCTGKGVGVLAGEVNRLFRFAEVQTQPVARQ